MSEYISRTVKENSLDSVFIEVPHSEKLGLMVPERLHLYYLNIRNNKFDLEQLKTQLYRNIGKYVFSRAKIENYKAAGDQDAIISRAIRVLKKNGGADKHDIGTELGELLLYVFLEEKLNAPKLMSRFETATDGFQYNSVPDNIHMLTKDVSGVPYHQMVFGSSNIVGEIQYAIDGAFDRIMRIEANETSEIMMVDNLVLDRFFDDEEIDLLKEILLPDSPRKNYNTSYGVFLGYTIGLDHSNYLPQDFEDAVVNKMKADLKVHIPYIVEKIRKNNLGIHSFYFYLVPFNDAETEKKSIMEDILKGDVDI